MNDEMQTPLEQIWSLLNFGPDECFESVGEVAKQLKTHRENLIIARQNAVGSMVAIAKLSDTFQSDDPKALVHVENLWNIQQLISQWSEMLMWCLQRDIIAMEVFLDLPSGHDASLN
jgi:hypothetical protein